MQQAGVRCQDCHGDTKAYGALSLEFACFRCHSDASKLAFASIGSTGSAYHTIGD